MWASNLFETGAAILALVLGLGLAWYIVAALRRPVRPYLLRSPEMGSAVIFVDLGLLFTGCTLLIGVVFGHGASLTN